MSRKSPVGLLLGGWGRTRTLNEITSVITKSSPAQESCPDPAGGGVPMGLSGGGGDGWLYIRLAALDHRSLGLLKYSGNGAAPAVVSGKQLISAKRALYTSVGGPLGTLATGTFRTRLAPELRLVLAVFSFVPALGSRITRTRRRSE